MSGKGDTPRPVTVSAEEWERRWKKAMQAEPKGEQDADGNRES
jgi:hypothetical protein